jgi:hypothetical protein
MQVIGDRSNSHQNYAEMVRNWRHVDRAKTKELVARVGGRQQRVTIRQSCGLRDLRIESTCATLAPSFGRPSRAPGRFAWIWTADSWRLSRNSFIHQSSRTDGRTDGPTDRQPAGYSARGGIYNLPTNKKISFFFLLNFVMLLQWQ